MPRTRKARMVYVRGISELPPTFAPTASIARAQVIATIRDAWGISFGEALSVVGRVLRWPMFDVRLPERHPLAPLLHREILHCVTHAYGGTGYKAGYRDHFYTDADDWALQAGMYHGLFRPYRRDKGRNGAPDMVMYALTDLGKNVAAGEVQTYPRY